MFERNNSISFVERCDNKRWRDNQLKTCNDNFQKAVQKATAGVMALPTGKKLRDLCE